MSGLVVYVANRICFILKDLIGMLNLEEEDWVEAFRQTPFRFLALRASNGITEVIVVSH